MSDEKEVQYAWIVSTNDPLATVKKVEVVKLTPRSIKFRFHGGIINKGFLRDRIKVVASEQEATEHWRALAEKDVARALHQYEVTLARRDKGATIVELPAERPAWLDKPLILD